MKTNLMEAAKIEHSLDLPPGERVKVTVHVLKDQLPITIVIWGEIKEAPLVRIHSRCMYGEVLKSVDCDCHAQLTKAIRLIQAEGSGILAYLEQEGRGNGLAEKARIYRLADRGLDTVEASNKLGVPVDNRKYDAIAGILKGMGLKRLRLLTNNPTKVAGLESSGLLVERVPLRTKPTRFNADYLRSKQSKLDQDLGL